MDETQWDRFLDGLAAINYHRTKNKAGLHALLNKYIPGWHRDSIPGRKPTSPHAERTRAWRERHAPRPFPAHWITLDDLAERMGISAHTLYMRMIWRRHHPGAVKWRNKWWFDPLTSPPDCATVDRGGTER